MRKNKKSRSSSLKTSTGFWISVSLLFLCAVFHFILFYNSFFRSLSKMNEEPIATITFKYKTAQRKFMDRNVWDRLRQNSPVYNGDTIHTSSFSEATIWFNDGNVMELSENTMAQVYLNDDKTLLAELDGGSVVFDSTGSDAGITLKSGGVQVAIEGGSSLSAGVSKSSGESQNASFQVLKGSVSVADSDGKGEKRKIGEGESVSVTIESDEKSGEKGAMVTVPMLTVVSPHQNQKFLYHTSGKYDVDFEWNIVNPTLFSGEIIVTVSGDKNFKNIVEEKRISNPATKKCTVSLSPQIFYWKVSRADGDDVSVVSSGKIQIVQSLPPELIAPVQNYAYSYRIKNPAVRLIWDESAFATSYLVEIADNKNIEKPIVTQRLSGTSSIIGSLSQGKYYWRVTPYYTINKTGYAAESEIGSFEIQKKNELSKPLLLTPIEGAMVNTDPSSSAISFSWRSDPDAQDYSVVVSEREDLSRPFLDKIVKENYIKLDLSSTKVNDGKWYWSVVSRDSEGNISPSSEKRMVYAMKGKPEQHTIEPVNGYKITQSLLADMKFTWKKNLPDNFTSEIEVATDPTFQDVVFTQKVTGSSATIKSLPIGSYFWRLKSTGVFVSENQPSENATEIATVPKEFVVVGNLDAAELKNPVDKILAKEFAPTEFNWNAVKDADYYKFYVYSVDGRVLLNETVYETKTTLDMFSDEKFIDRSYYNIQVQANAMEIPGISSRRTGVLSSKNLLLRKLKPVEVDFPAQNAVLDGTQVVLNPSTARWSSPDVLSEAQFVLSKIENGKRIEILRVPSDEEFYHGVTSTSKIAPFNVKLDTVDGLREGTYQIIIYAKTRDGIDLSNDAPKNIRTFKVSPVPKLPASASLKASPEVFDAEYLRSPGSSREIYLKWAKVPDATEYKLLISKNSNSKNGNNQKLIEKTLSETEYKIDFLSLEESSRAEFANGKFTWEIEAVRRYDTDGDGVPDKILQVGEVASSVFVTAIPTPRKTQAKGAVNPYGQ